MGAWHFVDQAHVDVQGNVGLGRQGKDGVVLRCQLEVPVRPAPDEGTLYPRMGNHPLELRHGPVHSPVGEQHNSAQATRVLAAELGQPVVVRPDQCRVELGVGVGEKTVRKSGGGIEDLGIDLVGVHLCQTGFGVVATGAHLLPEHPLTHIGQGHARRGVEAEVDGILDAFEDPGIACVESLHTRRPVLELGRDTVLPQVRWLVDMCIGVDELVMALAVAIKSHQPSPFCSVAHILTISMRIDQGHHAWLIAVAPH